MPKKTIISNKPPLGKLIATRLRDIDKNQKWLAEDTGLSIMCIHKVISGDVTPSTKTLSKIASSIDVDISLLLTTLLQSE